MGANEAKAKLTFSRTYAALQYSELTALKSRNDAKIDLPDQCGALRLGIF
jgi:hypothetical protein